MQTSVSARPQSRRRTLLLNVPRVQAAVYMALSAAVSLGLGAWALSVFLPN